MNLYKLVISEENIKNAEELRIEGELPITSCPIVLAAQKAGFSGGWSFVLKHAKNGKESDRMCRFARYFDSRRKTRPTSFMLNLHG